MVDSLRKVGGYGGDVGEFVDGGAPGVLGGYEGARVEGKEKEDGEDVEMGDDDDAAKTLTQLTRLQNLLSEPAISELWNLAGEWRDDATAAVNVDDSSEEEEEDDEDEKKDEEMKDVDVQSAKLAQPKLPMEAVLRFVSVGSGP
jgi:hypothetical protein